MTRSPAKWESRSADHGQPRGQDRTVGDRPPFGSPEVEADESAGLALHRPGLPFAAGDARLGGVPGRHRRWSEAVVRKRPGPLGAMADEDLAGEISRLPKGSSFMARATATCGPGCALSAPAQSAPGPAAHARARPAGASARQVSLTRPPRWHDHHRAGRCDVGRRPDLGDDRRGPGRGSSRSTTARRTGRGLS